MAVVDGNVKLQTEERLNGDSSQIKYRATHKHTRVRVGNGNINDVNLFFRFSIQILCNVIIVNLTVFMGLIRKE